MRDQTKDAIQKTKVAIIGAGFGGLAMSIRLLQSQINDFAILEKTPCTNFSLSAYVLNSLVFIMDLSQIKNYVQELYMA